MKITLPAHFDINNCEKYILTIEISDEFYAFSIYNPIEDGSYFYHPITNEKHTNAFAAFQDFFFNNEFLVLPFKKIYIVNKTNTFTFIPNTIYDDKDKEAFFKFNFAENEDRILVQTLREPELTVLHGMSEKVYEFFSRSFLHPNFIHHLTPQMTYFHTKMKMGNVNKLVINIDQKGLDMFCFSSLGEFVFANRFQYKHINDALYYIFFLWKQFSFNQLKDFVYVTGNASQKANLIQQIQKYVYNVIPLNINPTEHFYGLNIQTIPFELLALTLCEL